MLPTKRCKFIFTLCMYVRMNRTVRTNFNGQPTGMRDPIRHRQNTCIRYICTVLYVDHERTTKKLSGPTILHYWSPTYNF